MDKGGKNEMTQLSLRVYPFLVLCITPALLSNAVSNLLPILYLRSLVCCRFRLDGFVSNLCGCFLFLHDNTAAAAATPIGPANKKKLPAEFEVKFYSKNKQGFFSVHLRGRLWVPVSMQNTLIFFQI